MVKIIVPRFTTASTLHSIRQWTRILWHFLSNRYQTSLRNIRRGLLSAPSTCSLNLKSCNPCMSQHFKEAI
ncbi:hypothetical protein Hanom_Chr16g01473631 [Helianthus anomalus]